MEKNFVDGFVSHLIFGDCNPHHHKNRNKILEIFKGYNYVSTHHRRNWCQP